MEGVVSGAVCRCWLRVDGGYESSQCAQISFFFFDLVPCFPPGAYVFRVWWSSTGAFVEKGR